MSINVFHSSKFINFSSFSESSASKCEEFLFVYSFKAEEKQSV